MNVERVLLLVVTFLAVFWQAAFDGVRGLVGVQPDFLPPLIVYAALSCGLGSISTVAMVGGLLYDSLSLNPLGVSVLPLLLIGVGLHVSREFIMRTEFFAQVILGAGASLLAPSAVLMLLLTTGRTPVIGLGTLWQLMFLTATGAVTTPLLFKVFAQLHKAFAYSRLASGSFRHDREIRRGR